MAKLVIGCGYLGRRVARRWMRAGDHVAALTRSPQRAELLAADGLHPLLGDVARPESLGPLADWAAGQSLETVLYALGYDSRGGASRQAVQTDGLAAVLDRLPSTLGRLLFISTTGVYGGSAGEWIDENSPTRPEGESGRAALEAEQRLRSHPRGAAATVLRLVGIYGPGRLPRADALRRGEPLVADPESYVNLVHVDDAVAAVLATEARAGAGETFLVSDGTPLTRGEYYSELARQLAAPPPQFDRAAAAVASREASSRGLTNKRIRGDRFLAHTGLVLRYPSFSAGLAASLAESAEQQEP